MSARPSSRRTARALVGLVTLLGGLLLVTAVSPSASAAPGDVGFAGPSTAGAGTFPTGEKPESKLWWNDGRWWASMFDAPSQSWHIAYLDRATSRWVITPTVLDDRPTSRADTAWLGDKLYVASHVRAANNAATVQGQPARVYRYSYSAAFGYTLDAGFPVAVNDVSSETLVLDRDAAGRLWATWAQGGAVYVNATVTPGNDAVWGTPFVLPVAGASDLNSDDISTLVEYAGKVGVMWSNQTSSEVRFAAHQPTDPVATWGASTVVTLPGAGQADDHLNIKSLQGDATGRVFAVIKTSLDGAGPDAPSIVVLARSATGAWTRATFGTNADCHTRPVLILDSTAQLLHVYATAPDGGCPFTGSAGSIFEKTSPLAALAFTPGRGTPVMRDTTSPHLNNVTASKQTVTATTGIVLLSNDEVAQHYWSSDEAVTQVPAPTGSPTPSPTTSPTGSPTASPTGSPTASPTGSPTGSPTASPTGSPTASPVATVTASPPAGPSVVVTVSQVAGQTDSPTTGPTSSVTARPTEVSTAVSSDAPTAAPTSTAPTSTAPTGTAPTGTAPPTASTIDAPGEQTPATTSPRRTDHLVPRVSVAPFVVRYGRTANVTIIGTPGATVDLYARKYLGTFSKIRSGLVLDATGRAVVPTKPDLNLRFQARDRLVEEGSSVGGGDGLVTVQKYVSLHAARAGARRYTFAGSINPPNPGATVALYRNGTLVRSGIRVSAARRYAYTAALPAGTYTFQVRSAVSGYSNSSTSQPLRVRIR